LTVNGGTCTIRERRNIPIDEIRKQEGGNSILGRFIRWGKLYTDFENRKKLYAGALFPHGEILSQARFCGGKVYATSPGFF
jgi:hypothetical protein